MGISIHYRGKLKNLTDIDLLVDDFKDFAEIMGWEYRILNEDWSKTNTAKIKASEQITEIKGHLPLKGINLSLHPDCEALDLYFNPDGYLLSPISACLINEGEMDIEDSWVFVKTQYAPPDIHIAVVNLLDFLKNKYVPDLEVLDEGEYWETRDKKNLINKLEFLNHKLNQVEGILSSINREEIKNGSTEELMKLIEERLKKGLK